jgi:hypothetical protein
VATGVSIGQTCQWSKCCCATGEFRRRRLAAPAEEKPPTKPEAEVVSLWWQRIGL